MDDSSSDDESVCSAHVEPDASLSSRQPSHHGFSVAHPGRSAEGEEAQAKLAAPTLKTPASTILAVLRLQARKAMQRSVDRMHRVLARQREQYEEQCPLNAAPSLGASPAGEETNQRLVAAYEKMDISLCSLLSSVEEVREAEKMVQPQNIVRPAVIALAVSAQSTTWRLEDIRNAPFPRLGDAIVKVFLAAYSNREHTENKPKVKRKQKVQNVQVPHPDSTKKRRSQD